MNIVSVALPTVGLFSAVLSLQILDTNGPIGFGVSTGLTTADSFILYGTLDAAATDATNAYNIGYFGGGTEALPSGIAKQAATWPFLLVKRVAGSAAGSLLVAGNPLTAPAVVSTAAPTTTGAYSSAINLTTLGASNVRIGGSRQMSANDSFDVFLSNDATITTSADCYLAGRITGGGETALTSLAVSGFSYAIVQRVAGSTAGTIIAAGIAPSSGGGGTLNLTTLNVGNTAVNGPIGGLTAAQTVDQYSSLLAVQTTAGVTATLLSPTVTTAGKVVLVMNATTATQPLTMYGMTIGVGAEQVFEWTGAAWVGGRNVTQGGNAFGATLRIGTNDAQGVDLTSNTTGTVNVDSGTTGAVNVGTGTTGAGKVVTVGNTNGASEAHVHGGVGGIDISTGGSGSISILADNVGNITIDTTVGGAISIGSTLGADKTVTIGNPNGFASTQILSGSGDIGLAANGGNITLDASTGAKQILLSGGTVGVNVQCTATGPVAIRSGTSGTATFDSGTTGAVNVGTGASAKTVTVGSITGASATAIRSGSGALTLVNNGTTYTWPSSAPTASGQVLSSTTGGAMTWTGQVIVIANNSSGQSVADAGSPATLTGWTEVVDTAGAFTPATGVFVAPVTGNYLVCCEIEFSAIAAVVGAEFSIQIWVNGSLVTSAVETCQVAAANVKRQPKVSMIVPATATQQIIVRASQTSGSGANSLTFITSRNQLSISLVL